MQWLYGGKCYNSSHISTIIENKCCIDMSGYKCKITKCKHCKEEHCGPEGQCMPKDGDCECRGYEEDYDNLSIDCNS